MMSNRVTDATVPKGRGADSSDALKVYRVRFGSHWPGKRAT